MNSLHLAGWLAQAGLRNMPLEDMVDGFGRRLNEAGLEVERLFVGSFAEQLVRKVGASLLLVRGT